MRTAPAITSLLVLLMVLPPAVWADEEADSAKRGADFLATLTDVAASAFVVQRLGIYAQGQLVGYMAAELDEGEGDSPSYGFTLESEMRLGDQMRMETSMEGRFAANLRPIEASGEDTKDREGKEESKLFGYKVGAAGIEWTSEVDGAAETTRKIDGPADVVGGIEFLFARKWVGLVPGAAYRFRALRGEMGRIDALELRRGENRKEGDRDVFDLTVTKSNGAASEVATLVLDTTGAILSGKIVGSPFELKAITEDELDAWGEAQGAGSGSGSGSSFAAPETPVDTVAAYFVAIAQRDTESIVALVEPKTFMLNAAMHAAPTPEAKAQVRKDIEAKWAADPKLTLDAFVASLFAAANSLSKDRASYRPFLREAAIDAAAAVVEFVQGDTVSIRFELVKSGPRWKVVAQLAQK